MRDPGELQAKLKALSDTYAAQLPEKLKQLEQVFSLVSPTTWDEKGFQAFAGSVHKLDRLRRDLWVFIPQQGGAQLGNISQAA